MRVCPQILGPLIEGLQNLGVEQSSPGTGIPSNPSLSPVPVPAPGTTVGLCARACRSL